MVPGSLCSLCKIGMQQLFLTGGRREQHFQEGSQDCNDSKYVRVSNTDRNRYNEYNM